MVMSSCLCKKAEGAISPFVLFVVAIEDRVDDPIDAGDVHKANHGARATPDLHKAALDDVGRSQLAPEVLREVEEGQQLRQVALQPPHHPRIDALPAGPERPKRLLGFASALGAIDGLRLGLDRIVVPPPHLLQDIPHLVHPAVLMLHPRVDRLNRRRQSRASVRDDQEQVVPRQATGIQIVQKALPGGLAFALAVQEGQSVG